MLCGGRSRLVDQAANMMDTVECWRETQYFSLSLSIRRRVTTAMDRPAFVGAVASNVAVSLSAELNIASRTARPGRRIMPLVCYRLIARTSAANTLIVTAPLLGALAAAST